MNRSAVREFQAPDISVPRGELVVPSQVGDPARGPLPCPAAPLVGGSLLRKGLSCTLAPVPRLDDAGSDAGGALVYLATCPQRDGSTAALAAVAAPDDRLAAAAASAAVEEWAAVIATRTLLAAGSPWCSGALRALDAARTTVADQYGRGRVVHIYGELAAPPEAAADLTARGALLSGSLDGAAPGRHRGLPRARRAAGRPGGGRLARADDRRRHLPAGRARPGAGRPARRPRRRPGAHRQCPVRGGRRDHGPGERPGSGGRDRGRHRHPPGVRRPARLLPAPAGHPGGVSGAGDDRAAVPVPVGAGPEPGWLLLRAVRPGADHPGHRRRL